MDIKDRFNILVGVCALASFAQNASAQDSRTDDLHTLMKLVVSTMENEGKQQNYDFIKQSTPQVMLGVDDTAEKNTKKFKSADDSFADKLMEKIPYKKSLKHAWNIIDGDVDLYFEDLRIDRRNKGISYKMASLPMIGKVSGSGLSADLGEDTKLTFKSDYMPLAGRVDGFQFKASAGTNDSNISFRYKIDISW